MSKLQTIEVPFWFKCFFSLFFIFIVRIIDIRNHCFMAFRCCAFKFITISNNSRNLEMQVYCTEGIYANQSAFIETVIFYSLLVDLYTHKCGIIFLRNSLSYGSALTVPIFDLNDSSTLISIKMSLTLEKNLLPELCYSKI